MRKSNKDDIFKENKMCVNFYLQLQNDNNLQEDVMSLGIALAHQNTYHLVNVATGET